MVLMVNLLMVNGEWRMVNIRHSPLKDSPLNN